MLHKINTHDNSSGGIFLYVLLFNNQIDDIYPMISHMWHTEASIVVSTKTLYSNFIFYVRLNGLTEMTSLQF